MKVTSIIYPISETNYFLMVLLFFCHERILRQLYPLLSPSQLVGTRMWILLTTPQILPIQFNHLSQLCHSVFQDSVLKAVVPITMTNSFLPGVKGRIIQAIQLNWTFHMWRLGKMSLLSIKRSSLNSEYWVLITSLQPCLAE